MFFSYRKILNIVLPLIISGFGQSIIYVTDVLFLGRLGDVVLGASAIAGLFYASIMMIGFGISSGLQVIIAQKMGEGKQEQTHHYLINGIFLQGLIAIAFTLLYFLLNQMLMQLFVNNRDVRETTLSFLNIRILGIFPYFIFYAYRSYYLGTGETKIVSIVSILMSILNFVLNPLLIYGWQDIIYPLHYIGSAWASVISEWISTFCIMIFYAYKRKAFRFISYLKKEQWKEIINLSLPLIFQHFISVFSWFLFFLFIEKMGTKALAVSNIIRAVYILIMAPVLAFSHSTITIIGQIYGAEEYAQLKTTLWRVLKLSVVFTLPFSIVSFFNPECLMMIFTDDKTLLNEGRTVMQIISFALLYFAFSMPLLSAVTGLGETNKALLVESIAFLVYIFASALLVFVLQLSLPLVWCNEFVYFTCIAGLSYYFFNKKYVEISG